MAGISIKCLAMIASKPRRCPLVTAAICLFAVGAGGRMSHGAPIVFKFDATVSEVQGDVAALNLPFALAIGQQITGKYSFQSEEDLLDIFIHQARGKQGRVNLTIENTEFVASTNFGAF